MNLLIGKCLKTDIKNTVKVAIPLLKFDSFLNMHFRENNELYALDKEEACEPGDWILVGKLPEKISLKVGWQVEKIIYKNGHVIDPITGKKSIGYYLKDEPSDVS